VTIPEPRGRLGVGVSGREKYNLPNDCPGLQVSANNVLENGTLSTGLRSDNDNLWEIYGILDLAQ
jgi:hypothetical protein